jgi:hypothetical protein
MEEEPAMTRGAKTGWAALLAFGGAIIGYRLFLGSITEEERVRNLVRSVSGAFNEGRAGEVTRWLAGDFLEEASGLGRDEVRAFLLELFLREKDPRSREMLWQVEAAPEDLKVVFEDEEKSGATSACRLEVIARFSRRAGESAAGKSAVLISFTGELRKMDGRWLIARARHKVLEGRWPF